MICNSHEPLATPSIIARVSILQAWVVVQWRCRFNDSHRWDFPPPISTNLVVGCSVRGRSHFCCGSSSTVSSLVHPSFKSDLQSRPRKHPSGLTSLCSLCYQIGFAVRFQCLQPPLFAATLYLNPPWTFMQQEYGAIRTNGQQSSKLLGALHLCVIMANFA